MAIALVGVVVAIVALLALEWFYILKLLPQQGQLLLRLEAVEAAVKKELGDEALQGPTLGLPVGTSAPDFNLKGLYGETMTLQALTSAGHPVLLVFTDPNCGPCETLMPDVGRWQDEYGGRINVALISRGDPEANRAKTSSHGVRQVLLQEDYEVAEAYQFSGTPSAVLVGTDGLVASPLAVGPDGIRDLVERTVHGRSVPVALGRSNGQAQAPAPAAASSDDVGKPAPPLSLPDLEGRTVDLADFRGRDTLVLFWNPGCGFCQQMLPRLKAWEEEAPPDAPQILVVSSGSVEDNRALGLRSPVVLDASFNAGNAYNATGTPMAVMVDAEGRIASGVAQGADQVLALASRQAVAVPSGGQAPGGAPGAPPAPSVGQPAPPLSLPDLEGRTVDLADFRGKSTLVLFWNPGCGFCQQMLPDLRAWEAKKKKGPELVVVSTGSVEDNRALGLKSPVLMAEDFSVAQSFGASGTPMAVLVDPRGKIASSLAVGAPGVWDLVGHRP